ncbi:MAG: hypothetical protein U1E60_21175 [Reyranellaceae bacterium]
MSISLRESLRAVFYAPFYVALARGAFAAEGVEIEFVSSPRPQDAAIRLMDGSVGVCWDGPMRVMETHVIDRTEKWVAAAGSAQVAGVIARYFPDLPGAFLEAACARYEDLGIWNREPVLPREGYDRLRAGLVSGGFVSPGTPFEVAVDNSLAEQVAAERLPALA